MVVGNSTVSDNSSPYGDGNGTNTDGFFNDTALRDVPPCMQNTVLVWIPCGVLLLAGPVYVYYILHTRQCTQRQIPHTKLNVAKTVSKVHKPVRAHSSGRVLD